MGVALERRRFKNLDDFAEEFDGLALNFFAGGLSFDLSNSEGGKILQCRVRAANTAHVNTSNPMANSRRSLLGQLRQTKIISSGTATTT